MLTDGNNSSNNAVHPTYVVPFSHLDLFWAGTREECLSRGNQIIRRALDLLEAHADFRFLIETMNFLDFYLDCFPAEKGRVVTLAKEGRLELGPLWSAIYQNLPAGETLARNALLAKRYAKEKLGVDALVAHFGDLPGYTPQFPQIAALSGIRYALLSRGGPGDTPLFRWKAPDGTEIRAYYAMRGYAAYSNNTDWHKAFADLAGSKLEEMLAEDAAGKNHPMLIHWGSDLYAPSENLVFNLREWNGSQRRPLRFATLTEYFRDTESCNVPSQCGELPSAWPNIESTWPDVWPEDLPCEAAMHKAEFLSSFCLLRGRSDYPAALLEQAWKALLDGMDHNQNSQGGDIADKDKLRQKQWARHTAERIADQMARRIAAGVQTPQPHAFPVVVFNPLSWKRSGVVTGRTAAYGVVRPAEEPGRCDHYKLVDAQGRTVPYVQLQRYKGISNTVELAFHAEDLPAAGYRAYYLVPGENPYDSQQTCAIQLDADLDREKPQRNIGVNRYENRFFRLELDAVTGDATLIDKTDGETLFRNAAVVGVEERRGDYIFNMTPSGRSFPAQLLGIETVDNNAVWCRVRVRIMVYGVRATQTYTLYHDQADLLLENEVEWTEARCVRIQQLFPHDGGEITYGVPYGQVRFPETMGQMTKNCSDELDLELRQRLRLCRHWVDLGTERSGITIGCDHRMWEFEDKLLRSYMVRGAGFCLGVTQSPEGTLGNIPHPTPGTYRFQYRIRRRKGTLAQTASYRCGWELNHPAHAVAVSDSQPSERPHAEDSLFDFTDGSVVTTAVKQAESGDGLVIRAFETSGQAATVDLGGILRGHVEECDILEQPVKRVEGSSATFRPCEIKSFLLRRRE